MSGTVRTIEGRILAGERVARHAGGVSCRVCTNDQQSEIEKACKTAPVETVAERFGVNENALVRHLASHAPAKASKAGAKSAAKPRSASSRHEPSRAPSPPPRRARQVLEERREPRALEQPEEESPVTSRSPTPPPTARAALDEILAEIRTLMKGVNERRVIGLDADGENIFEVVPFADKAAAIRAALQATRLLAGLTGELGATEATVASSPYFKRMLQVILEAVRGPKFGEARQAIVEALAREERGSAREEDKAA